MVNHGCDKKLFMFLGCSWRSMGRRLYGYCSNWCHKYWIY